MIGIMKFDDQYYISKDSLIRKNNLSFSIPAKDDRRIYIRVISIRKGC